MLYLNTIIISGLNTIYLHAEGSMTGFIVKKFHIWGSLAWTIEVVKSPGVKSSGVRHSKIYYTTLGSEKVKRVSFLTLSLPRGLPLMSKIVWH